MTTEPRWWRGLLPESFTAVIGGVVALGTWAQSVLGGTPRPEQWVFAAGCLGVGTATTLIGVARKRSNGNGSAPS
jgi:hypothetical protein